MGGEVKALEKQLKEMKYLLEDADRRRHESKTIGNWIAEIRDLVYKAEAAIEIHAARVSSRRRQGLKKLLGKYTCILKECYSLHQLATEVSGIKSELARIDKDMQENGIKRSIINATERSTTSDNQNWTRKTFPNFEIDDCFVGKQDDVKQIISLVVDDKEHRVISVWGMGGIGKTTIVKRVYNQIVETKKGCFESFAWVCITQQCRVRSTLEDVLKQLIPQINEEILSLSSMQQLSQKGEDLSSVSDTELIKRLCQVQRSKKCLIVLDDLWETSQWEGLKHAFHVQDLQSKILVTTRQKDVAEIGFSVELGLLNMKDARELLKKKAFPHGRSPEFAFEEKALDRIGKEMVQKCGYLPLAISLLGGVLRKKSSIRDWELVNDNINTFIYRGEGHDGRDSEIDAVLNLSYENLPYYLKPCFLYMGVFKEDESIYVDHLYLMWIAQGMVSNENIRGRDETLMDIAELYLSELASRSIVQVEIDDLIPSRKYRRCKLHDVVRALCLKMGEKEDFGVQILEYQGRKFSTLPPGVLLHTKIRHLVIHFKEEVELEHEGLTITSAEDTSKHLRSFRMIIHEDLGIFEFPPQSIVNFQKFKLLRDLVIERFRFVGRKLPREITNLVHLRSLRLQRCELDKLPSSIRNFVYLDTLDLFGSSNVRVPNVLNKLFRLKHLVLPDYDKETIGNYRLRLDEGVDELESLMGLDSSVHELKRITRMKNLRRFSAEIHDNESLSAIVNAIATNWNKLQYCAVEIKDGCQVTSEEGLMILKQLFTCPILNYLGISIELGELPVSSDFISSKLATLSLSFCEIEDDPMGILGRLPCLVELYLRQRSFVGEEMRCPAFSFPRLKSLVLDRLPRLREWRVEQGAMPLLFGIHIQCCPHLEMVPDGLSCISTLEIVIISEMPELGKRVSASGDDFYKIRHVPSIVIHD
ncbi:probable disease resistance protein At1g58602 isoform X2 [Salvia miltiorrhiza]|nr:probable disease resistance protein At1g58602 isoform X2 [Salvia miltiorrhiza]